MRLLFLLLAAASLLPAQSGENVLLVVNRYDPSSVEIGDYYRPRRSVPVGNVCTLEETRVLATSRRLARVEESSTDSPKAISP